MPIHRLIMRAPLTALVLLVLAAACGGDGGPTTIIPGSPKDTVSTLPEAFIPNLLTVSAGTTVVFAFGGGIPHNVIFNRSAAGAPTDIQIVQDVFVSRTFSARGVFKFDCTVHPGMRGEVDVQ
jgi:plastocyanin